MRDDAVLRRALPLGRGLGRLVQMKTCFSCQCCVVLNCEIGRGFTIQSDIPTVCLIGGILLYTVNHKKGGSTSVIITLENLDGFLKIIFSLL